MAQGLAALTLLIVDDNAAMRSIVGTVVRAAGVRKIHFATNGAEGLALMRSTDIDVAYIDHLMPRMDGLELVAEVRRLKGRKRFIPIIMLTGYSDLTRTLMARDCGVNEFLRKPVTAHAILQRLNAVIMHPRNFASSSDYFGPDRRRHDIDYNGPLRRQTDRVVEVAQPGAVTANA